MDADIEILPMLSRGKHRSPRRGACFMELASYLAGERWSDKPACTHPLLAHLARLVNDLTEDAERPRLATLIPAVIGLRSEDPRWDDELTLLAASRALPVVSEHHQRALAVGILSCERRRAERTGETGLHPASRRALDAVPLAERWARAFVEQVGGVGAHHPGSAVVEIASVGLATACVPDPSGMLRELLADAITLCEHLAGREQRREVLVPQQWREVVTPAPAH
ncbi:hypothetical protein [Georgenia satyanarayanai]|uniref:hypothetical protein n=1 Tax=Georgenia satyanarayanai TaxID=860221 RepID=UPI001D0205E6|nr:hypothetical protein [Georgenia satyanarayanai]